MAKILVLHGPNLNLLGEREPGIYGRTTLEQINSRLGQRAAQVGHELETFQSNAEHELVDRVQAARSDGTSFILINPAAFTIPAWPCATHSQQCVSRLSRCICRTRMHVNLSGNIPISATWRRLLFADLALTATPTHSNFSFRTARKRLKLLKFNSP